MPRACSALPPLIKTGRLSSISIRIYVIKFIIPLWNMGVYLSYVGVGDHLLSDNYEAKADHTTAATNEAHGEGWFQGLWRSDGRSDGWWEGQRSVFEHW